MEFSMENNLTYTGVEKLLQLLNFHCPTPNNLPSSFYKLKKHYQRGCQNFTRHQYCSECDEESLLHQECSKRECRQKKAELCQYLNVNFEDDLQKMIEGKSEFVFGYQSNSHIFFFCHI